MFEAVADSTSDLPVHPVRRSSGCPFSPPQAVRDLAAAAPVSKVQIWDGQEAWLVTDYTEARALFGDARVSVDGALPGFPHLNEGMKALAAMAPRTMFNTDGEEHARYRRMLTKPFMIKRLDALKPVIQKYIDEHIDLMLDGGNSADLVQALALPVPSLAICELLGVPYEDHAFFQRSSAVGFSGDTSAEEHQEVTIGLLQYLMKLLDAKAESPAEDMLSDMAELIRAGELQPWEGALEAVGMLVAGHETTANMIPLSVMALLERPDQLALIRDTEDPKVLGNAVDELIRYMSIVQTGQRRIALEDIEIGDLTVRAGEGLILDIPSANWSAETFENPEVLDLERPNAYLHLGFGFGRHQCIGLQLARLELGLVLQTIFRRLPELRLAVPAEQVEFKLDSLVHGVRALPVEW
ncbi:cytochrome P450 [Nocardia sp. NBC_01503]|uniref:cytochrome P450 n=1 Tax=Nocardia sp. NBC_01503 TaxID=2975997 RepID=UPI002E7C4604|nr:cytochrome P450 [Nocardia sp. NBC_01503]WTL35482.1 cytochrome P450 [Nocardia sp. NBC_01503]